MFTMGGGGGFQVLLFMSFLVYRGASHRHTHKYRCTNTQAAGGNTPFNRGFNWFKSPCDQQSSLPKCPWARRGVSKTSRDPDLLSHRAREASKRTLLCCRWWGVLQSPRLRNTFLLHCFLLYHLASIYAHKLTIYSSIMALDAVATCSKLLQDHYRINQMTKTHKCGTQYPRLSPQSSLVVQVSCPEPPQCQAQPIRSSLPSMPTTSTTKVHCLCVIQPHFYCEQKWISANVSLWFTAKCAHTDWTSQCRTDRACKLRWSCSWISEARQSGFRQECTMRTADSALCWSSPNSATIANRLTLGFLQQGKSISDSTDRCDNDWSIKKNMSHTELNDASCLFRN